MTWTCAEIVWAIEGQAMERGEFLTVGRRQHYVRVYGPRHAFSHTQHEAADRHVGHLVVEKNGSVSFNDENVAHALGAQRRPLGVPGEVHPLGHNSGPNLARFEWGLSADDAMRFKSVDEYAGVIRQALTEHQAW